MKLQRAALLILLLAVIAGFVPWRMTVHAQRRAALSGDLFKFTAGTSRGSTRVIVPGDPDEAAALSARHHVHVVRRLEHGVVVQATRDQLEELIEDADSPSLSGDLPVADLMSVSSASTGADQVHAGKSGGLLGLGGISGMNGQGVVIAVLDSGIASHKALNGRVLASVSKVAGEPATDEFGHGTHVAGIITGSGSAASGVTPYYTGGIAPGAQLVSVRVLGDDGVGYTSDVIDGIDWVIDHKAQYNIRIINLSLGHAVTEPSLTDPLCQAVARAYAAGLVVVAAAGNAGKLADGTPVLGGIASPGNSPYAITVGALNTWGTVSRADDTLTTYSSRGPTAYEYAVKPDLAAPGNKIISLEANGSYLATHYPAEHIAGSGLNAYFRMSGTSMSTPMISAGAALLLQASPALTPAQVKFLLQTGSTYMTDAGLLGAGAGSVNLWTSRQEQANANVLTSLLGLVLDRTGGASFWDAGTMQDRLYSGSGLRLLNILELPGILLNPAKLAWGDLNLLGSANQISLLAPKRLLYGDVSYWTSSDHIVWSDDITSPEGQHIVWSDTDSTDDYHIVWSDSVRGSSDPH
jgi:serine protease AprX